MNFKKYLPSFLGGKSERKFDAAIIDRTTADWVYSPIKDNEDLRRDYKILVTRARDAAKNNSLIQKYLNLVDDNVVGSKGFNLQMRIKNDNGQPDNIADNIVENGWYDFGRAKNGYFTIDGKVGCNDFTRLVCKTRKIDGEAFIQIFRGVDNPYGISFRLIDSLDIDPLYTVYGQDRNGVQIFMGIERDKYGKPLAYWTREDHNSPYYGSGNRVRIPAEQIIHIFKQEYPNQVRGVTALSGALQDINHLKGYLQAELIAARIGACQMGMFEPKEGEAKAKIIGDTKATETTPATYEMSPGAFMKVPKGYSFKQLAPTHPAGNFDGFNSLISRNIACGLNVSFPSLTGNADSLSYGTYRGFLIIERDSWMTEQEFIKENFLEIIFQEWLKSSLMNNALTSGKITLPFSKFAKYNQPEFFGKRWQWIDPLKDLAGAVLAIDNGLKSPQEVASDLGRDYTDIVDDLVAAKALLESKNFVTNAQMKNQGLNLPEIMKADEENDKKANDKTNSD